MQKLEFRTFWEKYTLVLLKDKLKKDQYQKLQFLIAIFCIGMFDVLVDDMILVRDVSYEQKQLLKGTFNNAIKEEQRCGNINKILPVGTGPLAF